MKTILIPTDFSDNAAMAFSYGLIFARKISAEIILYHVTHVPHGVVPPPIASSFEYIESKALEDLIKWKDSIIKNERHVEVKLKVETGFAVDEISAFSKKNAVDMIIMGTKGASGIHEVFLGSNAAAVIEKASCPVLIIPDNAKFKNIEKIVFATNFQDSDFQSISFLAEMASLFNSEILIVHIVQLTPVQKNKEDLPQWFKEELKKKVKVEYGKISFHVLTGGNVNDELENFMVKNNVDLLSLSMRKRTLFSKLFDRSLTKKMAYHTHTPLLAFHAMKE